MNSHILTTADKIIKGERQRDYGAASHSFQTIATMWSAYLGMQIKSEQVALMMVLLKVARSTNTATEDSLVDIAGYAALAWVAQEKTYEEWAERQE